MNALKKRVVMDALQRTEKMGLLVHPLPDSGAWCAGVQAEVRALADLTLPKGEFAIVQRRIRATISLEVPIGIIRGGRGRIEGEMRKILPGVEVLDWHLD